MLGLGLAIVAGGCEADDGGETPRVRGDRAFAVGDYEDALAEYRLSMLEDPSIEATLRAAHAYAKLGRVDEARNLYDEAVREDSVHAEQAVSDFVARAREAFTAGDHYGGASAIETAQRFRPGIVVEELVLPLARHYSNIGRHGHAQPLYLRALGSHRRNPDVMFEAARAHQEIGDCERALEFFAEFVDIARRRERETRWYIGSCAFQLAQELVAREAFEEALVRYREEQADTVGVGLEPGDPSTMPEDVAVDEGLVDDQEVVEDHALGEDEALVEEDTLVADEALVEEEDVLQRVLGYLDLVLELEEPRATLPEVYFWKGDVLARMGECEGAIDAYGMVPMVDVSGSQALAARARQRVDEIRFGEGEGPC